MSSENLIHVKVNYDDAVDSKKDVLSSEMNLLMIIKSLKRYQSLRNEELRLKAKFYRKIKEIIATINLLESSMPKISIQEKPKKIIEKKTTKGKGVEDELQEISRKLKAIR